MLPLVWSSWLQHDRSWKEKMRVETTEEEHIKQRDGVFSKKCRGKQKKKINVRKIKLINKGAGEEQMKGKAERRT